MGAIVKGIASAFGGKKRRAAEKTTQGAFQTAEGVVQNQDFSNAFGNLQGGSYEAGNYQAQQATAATLGEANTMERNVLGSSQGYDSQGYDSQGYSAQTTNVGGLQRGANTGLTNTMNNLQVNTAEADMAAQEADQALAASQDLAAQAGTGAGGATALAAAAAKSKQGIAASIGQQESQNNIRRASAEQQLQQAQLAQGNIASQFDLGQSQQNMSSINQASQFGASAQNQASQFTASAQNQAAQFGAQASNQFALSQFGADNARDQFNASTQNQFQQTRFNAANQFEMANVNAQNQGSQFNIGNQIQQDRYAQDTAMRAAELGAQGSMRVQDMEYGRNQDTLNRRAGEYGAAKDARAQAKGDLIGGIAGIGDLAMTAATGGFGGGKGLLGKIT